MTSTETPDVISHEIAQEDMDRIAYVYEKPQGYLAAHKQLSSQHIVVIQGPVHVGKRAGSIKLALDVLGPQARIEELSPDINLIERIKPEYIKSDTVYLVDGLVASWAEKLTEHNLKSLGERLQNQKAYLIICVTSDIRLPKFMIGNLCHAFQLPDVKNKRLVEKHIEYFLCHDNETIDSLLINQCLDNEKICIHLAEKMEPEAISYLANVITDHIKGDCTLEESLQKYSTFTGKTVQEWFEECGEDLDERAYRIALAVLNEARVNSIDIATRDLANRLKFPHIQDTEAIKEITIETTEDTTRETTKEIFKETPKSALNQPSPFAQPRKSRLERARAHIETERIFTEYSDQADVMIVCLNDQNYQFALIKYLWEEYGSFQDTFLDWLSDLAIKYERDIRERAAVAVGFLATIDFESIRLRVLVKWAFMYNKDRELGGKYRLAIRTAIQALMKDGSHLSDVLNLLGYWSEYNSRALVWAAVRAYSSVGLYYPHKAMEAWRSILESSEGGLTINHKTMSIQGDGMLISLIDAIEYLFTSAFEEPKQFHHIYEQLLEALKNWIQLDRQPKSKSCLGLPLLMIMMKVPMPTDDTSSQTSLKPPALLALFDAENPNQPALDNLIWLLRQILNDQFYRLAALELIHNWFLFVDNDTHLMPSLRMIFKSVLAQSDLRPRERDRLKIYFHRWAIHPIDEKKSKSAQELLDELNWSEIKALPA